VSDRGRLVALVVFLALTVSVLSYAILVGRDPCETWSASAPLGKHQMTTGHFVCDR
jgi:hypothetical protein